jgi:hypothetical protein
MILVHKLAIAIGAFNPTVFARNLQPDARMATFATIARNAVAFYDFGFRRLNGHRLAILLANPQAGQSRMRL